MKKVEENIIVVGDMNYNYDEFITTLSNSSIKNITDILRESQITLPRKFNVTALRLALNEKIVIAKTLNLSDEELFRLRFYPFFNEFQLQKLFNTLFDENIFANYRKYLMELIIQNNEYLRLEDNLINKLLNVPNKNEDYNTYQEVLNSVCYDFEGYFDAIKFEDYDDNLLKSLTSDDIRQLGAKYDVIIPKRLKKEELISYVKEVMELNGKLIPENVNLDSQSIMMVQRFAKKNNIKISADLKKDECLNYLFHQVNKKDLELKKEVLLNLYLGDTFVFDLSYVLKTEEKAPLPEVVVEDVKEEETLAPVIEGAIEVIDETPVTETKEEVSEEVKAEPEVKETTTVVQSVIDPKELVNIITKSVKEIVVDVVKEIVPLFNKEEKEEVVKTEEDLVEEKIYNYANFSNQTNPYYDEEIHHYIRNYDCKGINPNYEEIKIDSNKFSISDITPEEVNPEVVEEENLDNLTEEEILELKKQKKEQKRQAKIDKKNLSKEEKAKRKEMAIEEKARVKAMNEEEKAQLKEQKRKEKEELKLQKKALREEEKANKKQAKVEEKEQKLKAKIEEKERIKAEKEQEKINKRLEAEQAKIKAKEEKKENKLKLKEDKRIQKETDKKNKAQAKIDLKNQIKQAKIDEKERIKAKKEAEKERQIKEDTNYNEMQKLLYGKHGEITKVDDEYFHKYMSIVNYRISSEEHQDKLMIKRKGRSALIFKIIFNLLFFAGIAYVGFGVYLSYFSNVANHPVYTFVMNNQFLKMMFEPFVNWFIKLVPQFKPSV